jgi:hypothetical protein
MKRHKAVYGCVALAVLIMLLGSLLACGGAAPAEEATGGIQFPDKVLEGVIRDLLAMYGGPIQAADLLRITQISGARSGIKDLTGVEYCTAVNQFYLDGNEIVDVTPLSQLTQVTRIWMSQNKVKDISPLVDLTNLVGLSIGDAVEDISVVGGMTKLKDLSVSGPFSDISAVANLTALTSLNVENSQVSDLSVLATDFEKLTRLTLANCPVSDIKPLVDNPNMKTGVWINLKGCPLNEKSINEYIPALQKRGVIIAR